MILLLQFVYDEDFLKQLSLLKIFRAQSSCIIQPGL